ncbi:Trk system potassium transporter TrkA [Limibaculum sp. M0105]|uniref:Trk system potassium uptake protein TrkA n=1 Tax=Thermohalobaculum xanthum TaxID=2753746 RepID=A0A8J7M4B0_9RHOB|nr:Trk system potassium transporter TrkA [Thermohalobaculum xanthum]MBK0397968.1 Trk system potassium transporter TrkA [Thermohalobaculum xanthum]
MKVIVCGAGQVGFQIARHLSDEGNAVTVIDNNPELVRRITDLLDVSGVIGFASHPDILSRAGAHDCDMIIAATSMDEVNMVSCQVAHSVFEVPTKIARVRTESYLEAEWSDLFRRDHMPIDVIISPETEVARVTLRRLGATAALDIEPFLDGAVHFVGVKLEADCPVLNTPLRQLSELFSTLRAIVVAVRREGRLFVASPSDQLYADDEIYFIAAREDVQRTFGIFGRQNLQANRVVIVGAGNVGLRVARELEQRPHFRATLIERDRHRAEFAADRLERTIVLHGDALDSAILAEAGIADADAIVALTDDDRTNLLGCALAGQAGCPISIALSKDPTFERIAAPLGVNALINPRATTVSSILRHVRRGKIRAVYSVGGGEGEVIEAQVMSTSPLADKRLRDINFPAGSIVGAIQSGGEVKMPHGDLGIRVGDVLVIFAQRSAVHQVEQMFRVSVDYF